MNIRCSYLLLLIPLLLINACDESVPEARKERKFEKKMERVAPKAMAEFRAAWVASVSNINWPSKPGLSTAEQQKEAIALLDYLEEHNFNAVIFQVRPQADALYKSDLEPWSYFLTGETGKAPDPFYDPLEFWIKESHARGMELHVWLNPYRSHHKDAKAVHPKSLVKTRPELSLYLKNGYYWMDPAKKETQKQTMDVVMDIMKRYDIDGVHFDDYFYPYPDYNKNEDFPDDKSWAAYQKDGGKLSRGDWRRKHVNDFIEELYKNIKAEKKHVKFGISPFGVWRPGYPRGISGLDQYNVLYADAKLWLNEGWMDYFAPQLYWNSSQIAQSFPVLLGWWQEENTEHRHLWPGISDYKGGGEKNTIESVSQIMISRGMLPQSMGTIHWSITALTRNEHLSNGLKNGPYKTQALIPPSPWLDDDRPKTPEVTTKKEGGKLKISWKHPDPDDVFKTVVYYQRGGKLNYNTYRILPKKAGSFELDAAGLSQIGVSAVDRTGNESELMVIDLN